jgi:hypothetical protein
VSQENPRDALEELQGAGYEYIDDPLGLKTGAQTEEKKACFERYKNLLDSVFRNDENLCNTGDLFDGRNQEICQFYLLLNEMRLAPKCFVYALEALRDSNRGTYVDGNQGINYDDLGWHGL